MYRSEFVIAALNNGFTLCMYYDKDTIKATKNKTVILFHADNYIFNFNDGSKTTCVRYGFNGIKRSEWIVVKRKDFNFELLTSPTKTNQ